MIESQIRDMFAETAGREPAPSRVDVQAAQRRGKARLRWRRAGAGGGSAMVAGVAAALVVGLMPGGTGPAPADAGPPAPARFSPLVTNLTFGWLPAGYSVEQGGVQPALAFAVAGPQGGLPWEASAYARGRCHVTAGARGLACAVSNFTTARFSQRAPSVDGRPAYWAGASLIWQYARGGWAILYIPVAGFTALRHNPALEREALRIAGHVRVGGVSAPLAFPAQFTGLDSQWQLYDVHYFADSKTLFAMEYTLHNGLSRFLPHVGDLGVWTNAAYVIVHPAPKNGTCDPADPSTQNKQEVINGFHVVVKHGKVGGEADQELCGAHVAGLWFDLQEFGTHNLTSVTALFRDHVKLLGRDPAKWVSNPVG